MRMKMESQLLKNDYYLYQLIYILMPLLRLLFPSLYQLIVPTSYIIYNKFFELSDLVATGKLFINE